MYLKNKDVLVAYIRVIKNTDEGVNTRVRTLERDTDDFRTLKRDTDDFLIEIELHQGLALNSFLFTMVMVKLTEGIPNEVS